MPILAIAGDPLLLVGAVLLGLLSLLSWLARRTRARIESGRATVMLTSQHAVHVVEIAGRRLLVGTGPSGSPRVLVELGEAEPGLEPEPPAGPWVGLRERLGKVFP